MNILCMLYIIVFFNCALWISTRRILCPEGPASSWPLSSKRRPWSSETFLKLAISFLIYTYLYHFPPLIGIAIRHFKQVWRRYWWYWYGCWFFLAKGTFRPSNARHGAFRNVHKFTHVFKSSDRDRWHIERRFWLIVIFSDYLEIIWVFLSWHLGCKVIWFDAKSPVHLESSAETTSQAVNAAELSQQELWVEVEDRRWEHKHVAYNPQVPRVPQVPQVPQDTHNSKRRGIFSGIFFD